jgi:hypothetical protein
MVVDVHEQDVRVADGDVNECLAGHRPAHEP